MAFHEERGPAAAAQQLVQFRAGNARQNRRVGNFIAVEVKNREDRAVADRIEELVGVPGGRQRAGFGFSITNNTGGDEIGVIEDCAERVAE